MKKIRPFHVAFPVRNLDETRKFYAEILSCKIGRQAETWMDFDLYGHQLSAHLSPDDLVPTDASAVDGKQVPVRHWGVILEWEEWEALSKRLKKHKVKFIIEPYIRFKGLPGEQGTLFFSDPSGNILEFKSFKNDTSIFAT